MVSWYCRDGTKRILVSKEHFLNFLPLEVLLPCQLSSAVAGSSLAFHPPRGSGRARG